MIAARTLALLGSIVLASPACNKNATTVRYAGPPVAACAAGRPYLPPPVTAIAAVELVPVQRPAAEPQAPRTPSTNEYDVEEPDDGLADEADEAEPAHVQLKKKPKQKKKTKRKPKRGTR